MVKTEAGARPSRRRHQSQSHIAENDHSPPSFFAPRRFPLESRPFFVDPPPRLVDVRIWTYDAAVSIARAYKAKKRRKSSKEGGKKEDPLDPWGKSCARNSWQTDDPTIALARAVPSKEGSISVGGWVQE